MILKQAVLLAGANKRLSFPIRVGETIQMRGNGIYMSLDKEYVLTYYSELSENEVLLTLEFDPTELITGNLEDRETEFSVSEAKIIDVEHLVHDSELFEERLTEDQDDLVQEAYAHLQDIDEDIWNIMEQFLIRTNGKIMWHGASNKILSPDMGIIKNLSTRTNPKNTPLNIHNDLIKAFSEAGFKANRDDFFVTGDMTEAGAYGTLGAVFPLGEFSFTWSPMVEDFFTLLSNDYKSAEKWLDISDKDKSEIFSDIYQKYAATWQDELNDYKDEIKSADENGEEHDPTWESSIAWFQDLLDDPRRSDDFVEDYKSKLDITFKLRRKNLDGLLLNYDYAVYFIKENYRDDDLAAAIESEMEIMLKAKQVLWINDFMVNDVIYPWLYEHIDLEDVLYKLSPDELSYVANFTIREEKPFPSRKTQKEK